MFWGRIPLMSLMREWRQTSGEEHTNATAFHVGMCLLVHCWQCWVGTDDETELHAQRAMRSNWHVMLEGLRGE